MNPYLEDAPQAKANPYLDSPANPYLAPFDYNDAIDASRVTMDQAWQRAGNAMAAANEREAATAAANQQRYRDEFGGPRATGVTPAGTADTAFLETVAKDPVGFVKAIPDIAMGAVAAPGKLAYNAAADVVSAVANQPEYGGNLASMMTGAERTPAETFIGSAAKDAPKLAVAANVAKVLPELASMMAVNPSGAAGRLLALGFSADMIHKAKPLFDEYAAEKNLPEPDAGSLAELEAGIIQTFAFAPLAGAHGVGGSLNAGRLAMQDRVGRPDMNAVDTAAREAFNPAQAQQRGTVTTENPYLVKTEIGKQKSEMPEPGARELDYGQGGEMPRQSSEFRGPRPEPQIISAPQAAAKNVPGAAEPIAAAPEQSLPPFKRAAPQVAQPLALGGKSKLPDGTLGANYVIPGFEEYRTVLLKPEGNKAKGNKVGWRVVEASTGLEIAHPKLHLLEDSPQSALELARKKMSQAGKQKLDELIQSKQPKPVEAPAAAPAEVLTQRRKGAKGAETPAAAVAKVTEHVAEVASGEKVVKTPNTKSQTPTTGPRAAKEIKSELVQRLEKEIAKLPAAPELLYTDPKKVQGRREFYVVAKEGGQRLRVREAANTSWTIETEKLSGKTGVLERKVIGNGTGDVRAATRAAESVMEKLLAGNQPKITIEIPGDGTFTIERTHAALGEVLKRASALDTRSSTPAKKSTPPAEPSSPDTRAMRSSGRRIIDEAQTILDGINAGKFPGDVKALDWVRSLGGQRPYWATIIEDRVRIGERHNFTLRQAALDYQQSGHNMLKHAGQWDVINKPVETGKSAPEMPGSPGGSGHGSTAYPPLNFPKLAGGVDAIRPMETPEILRLAVEMSGDVPSLKKLKRYMGYARAGKITMDYETFRDPQRLAMTLAHELGHVNDWFPDGTMKRGNVIGRLIGSVNQFLKGSFGNLNNKELRAELVDLSAYWHPWDRTASPEHYRKYRDSAVELYAEAVSVLLNSPGLLEQKAPKFYKAFFEHLDKKPKFRDEFFALQDLLARGPEAVLGERSKQSREQFMSGAEVLHEKIAFREAARNSFKDFLTKVRIQSLDIADFVRRRLGSKDPRQASEFDRLYEESRFEDNRNTADVQRIYHEMVLPIIKTGLDVHEFGQVLELQRIIGGLDAYKDMQAMRQTLGPDKMSVLKKASEDMANLERQGLADELGGNVIGDLDRAGIPGDLIDTYRQLSETQGTRAELANPQGRSPIMAQAELDQLLKTVTPEQRAELLNSSARFRQLVFERATEARDVGIINKLTYDATIVPNKENYAAFRPLDKIEPFVSPMVRKARGTLKDIENPFITTLLKLQSLNNLIETQRVKNLVRDEMSRLHPADFKPAETRWSGRRMEAVPAKPGIGRVGILENGRLVQYDTDPYISKMFDQLTPTDSFWLNKILEVPFRMGIYPLIIKYNPGFLFAFNPRRDMARTIRNLYAVEGVTRRELLPNYASPEVLKAVNDYLAGRPNPLAEAMIKNKAITTSWQGFSRIDQQDVMTDLLRRYKLAGEPHKSAAMRTLMWLPEKINQGGAFLEALPKFASYKTLIERGVGPERAAFLVRNYAGTPNFKIKGEFANVQNSYVPFINIFTQGWRSDLKIATNPKTAGGWWMQWALQHGWQAVVVGMATAGVFGDDIKKLYEGISEYDKTNYGTLPLGSQIGAGEFGNKTVYLRFPRDETSRLFSAMTYKTTRAIADQVMKNPGQPQGLPTELFAFGAGVIPSPSPVLNVAGAWKDYLAGRNPIDPFRNKPVIGQREFKAGGAPAVGDMVTWTLNQSGALNLVRWNPQSETTTELAVSGTPVINRLVKISDQGYREAQMNSETLDAKAKAQLRVQYNDSATALVAQHAWLQSLGAEKRTPEQNDRYAMLHAWKTGFYDRADEAAWNTRKDKGQQRAIIQQINTEADRLKKSIEPTARFTYGSTNTLLRALGAQGSR